MIPTAVEEFLRAYAPVSVAREVIKETHINGCHFKEGEMVLMAFPAANRDPAKFSDADRVVIDRRPNSHAAFGLGIHRCIGDGLATMEITVALQPYAVDAPVTMATLGFRVETCCIASEEEYCVVGITSCRSYPLGINQGMSGRLSISESKESV